MCNKYFLRTHLLNKHGLHWDMMGPQSSSTPAMPFGLPPGALPPHLLERGGPLDLPLGLMPGLLPPRMSDEMQPLDLKKSSPNNNNDSSRKDSRQNKDGGSGGGASSSAGAWSGGRRLRDDDESAIGFKKCDICGVFVGDKVALQLHMIQDHPGDVIVSAKSKLDELGSRFGGNIGLSLRKKYQKNRRVRGHFRRLLGGSAGGNGVTKSAFSHVRSQPRKKYRCAHCQDRFASRVDCQAHIRARHRSGGQNTSTQPGQNNGGSTSQNTGKQQQQQVSPGNKENALPVTKASTAADIAEQMDTSSSSLEVSHASPLPNGVDSSRELVMQSFYLEGQGSFAPAKLVLPVYQKVNEPISITFTLKPSPQ